MIRPWCEHQDPARQADQCKFAVVPRTLFDEPWSRLDGDISSSATWSKSTKLTQRLVLVIIVARLATTWVILWPRPSTYSASANVVTWNADVENLLSRGGAGTIHPTGHLAVLPGVGKIYGISVERTEPRKGTVVFFWTTSVQRASALEYLVRVPPAMDECDVHLAGPWWQMMPLNDNTVSCPNGFTFTPSP